MAEITTKGIDKLVKQFQSMGKNVEPACMKAVKAGGDVLAAALHDAAPYRTGALAESIKAEKAKAEYGKGILCLVHPTGEQHGERNGEIAFVTEYGRSNMPPRPWWFPTVQANESRVGGVVKSVFLEEIKKE